MTSALTASALAVAIAASNVSADSPIFRGPNGNGTYPDGAIRTDWKAKPPKVLWQCDVGYGFSQVVVAGGKAVTAGYPLADKKSLLYCFDAQSGKELWKTEYADTLGGQRNGVVGPVATPAISGDKIYMVAAMGAVYCFDLNTGAKVWERVVNKDSAAGKPLGEYGDGASAVVDGDVIVAHLTASTTGAAWYALKKQDGSVMWSLPVMARASANARDVPDRGYSPAGVCDTKGGKQAVLISNGSIDCADLQTGKAVWIHSIAELQLQYGPFSEPVFFDKDKFLSLFWYSKNKNDNAVAYQVGTDGPTKLWSTDALGRGTYSCVFHNGFFYGYGTKGFSCVSAADGKAKWKWRAADPKFAKDQGEVILVGDNLVWISTCGMLYAAKASPDKCAPFGEFRAIGKCTKDTKKDKARYNDVVSTSPSFSDGRLFCRAPWGDVVCLDVSGK